ncbi:MAG: PKD domain-containing protein, partial [Candidatus Bathyarchaeota archaeon]
GFQVPPPGEWWYEPDWPGELEGWWALGYFGGPFNWPAGSDWWVNYTACSVIDVDYNTDPFSTYVDYDGSYADFLALSDPTNTIWNEVLPMPWQSYNWTAWTDGDTSGNMTVGDFLEAPGNIIYRVDGISTDLSLMRKPWIVESDPTAPFFGTKPLVTLASFPHPERAESPWLNNPFSVPLPHKVENATYTPAIAMQPPVADFTFSPTTPMELELVPFDASGSFDADGTIVSYFWDFDDGTNATGMLVNHAFSAAGTFNVTLTVTDNSNMTNTYWELITVIERTEYIIVNIDVGEIHFAGETNAEFYILVDHLGVPVDATTLSATLYYNGSAIAAYTALDMMVVDTGLYLLRYDIPANAEPGEYELHVVATYGSLQGTNIEGFLISSTLTDWHARLINIESNTAAIMTDLGLIHVRLDDLNATLLTIQGNTATIITNLGALQTDVNTINAMLISIDVTVAMINSTLGVVQMDVDTIKAMVISIDGTVAMINSTLGVVQMDVDTIKAMVISIDGTVAMINSTLGTLETNLMAINATLTDLVVDNGVLLAEIQTTLGTITTTLDTIDTEVTNIAGDVVTLQTTLGGIETSIGDLQASVDGIASTMTIGLAAASILSAIAAIVAILIFLRRR